METLETSDMQGLIVRGYSEHVAARYFMLKITDANAAKAWLAGMINVISPGKPKPGDIAVNIAFTFPGLTALGLAPLKPHANFSPEFLSGMVEEHRSRTLGDTDQNAPAAWEWGGPSDPVDLVLMVFAKVQLLLDASYPADMSFADHGMNLVKALETSDLGGFEQFGFHDGI
ncbi:MAG TPA: hypothetical protein VFC46_03945, partial [Humisphaera sp.]|nr:hypothetical protein [Humisphaera sp.]